MSAVQLARQLPLEWRQLAQRFASWPEAIAASAFEVCLVAKDLKPAARTIVSAQDLAEVTGFLGTLGLQTHLRLDPRAGQERYELVSYSDRTLAQQLAASFTLPPQGQYMRLGELLGYPSCCIEWAVKAEFATDDSTGFRKSNLVETARARSNNLFWELNPLLRESWPSQLGPVAAISHYPCRFDCAASLALAHGYLDALDCDFPEARSGLKQLLSLKVISWRGTEWPQGFDSEQCGVVRTTVQSGAGFLALCRRSTPAGIIPEAGLVVEDRWLTEVGAGEGLPIFDLQAPGRPQIYQFG